MVIYMWLFKQELSFHKESLSVYTFSLSSYPLKGFEACTHVASVSISRSVCADGGMQD